MAIGKNDDYKKGIKFLRTKCKELGIDVRKFPWVTYLSSLLSETNDCYKFWWNTYEQNKLHTIIVCQYVKDIMFGETCMFVWSRTIEGEHYWRSLLDCNLFFRQGDKKLSDLQ